MPTRSALVIAAKYPDLGVVKTRLARRMGYGLATELYHAFLHDLDARLSGAFSDVYWGYTPSDSPFPSLLGPDRNYLVQEGDDLGERMFNLFRVLFLQGYEKIVLIGSDIPHLSPDTVAQAFDKLERCDVLMGPAEDGGYYLLGMRDLYDLFSFVSWSTPLVFTQTLIKAAEQGLTVDLLPETFDVDEPEDIDKLIALLRDRSARAAMPATATVLSRLLHAGRALGHSRVGKYFKLTPEQTLGEEQECARVIQLDRFPDGSMAAHLFSVSKVASALVTRFREDLDIPLSDIAVVAARYHDCFRSDDRSRRLRPYGVGPRGFFITHDGHEVRLACALRKTRAKTVARIVRKHNVVRCLYPEERAIDENILLIADAMVEGGKFVPISVRRDAVVGRYGTGPEEARAFEMAFDIVARTLEMYFDAGLDRRRFFKELGLQAG